MTDPLHYLDIRGIAGMIRHRGVSSREVTQALLDRIARPAQRIAAEDAAAELIYERLQKARTSFLRAVPSPSLRSLADSRVRT